MRKGENLNVIRKAASERLEMAFQRVNRFVDVWVFECICEMAQVVALIAVMTSLSASLWLTQSIGLANITHSNKFENLLTVKKAKNEVPVHGSVFRQTILHDQNQLRKNNFKDDQIHVIPQNYILCTELHFNSSGCDNKFCTFRTIILVLSSVLFGFKHELQLLSVK